MISIPQFLYFPLILDFHQHIILPHPINVLSINSFEPAIPFKSVILAVSLKLLSIREDNVTLAYLLVFFEIAIVDFPVVVDVVEVGEVEFSLKSLRIIIVEDSVSMEAALKELA